MFLVFNKQKIVTYFVSVLTVVLLFFVASTLNRNDETVETSATGERLLPIYNVKTEEKKVAFTMNCAWNADDIDSILKTLEKENVKITFFMVGEWMDKYPEAVEKIYKAGHEIANHSDTHKHVNNLSYEDNVKEIESANEKIKKITGVENKLYRAPYGEYNNTVIKAAKENGYIPIQWSLDTIDYTGITGEEMWNRKHTADSLEMLIKNIKEKGFEIVKVSDLIYQDNYKIDINGTQIKDK